MAVNNLRLTIPSFAKINWTLEILGKRPDGYHELRTLLQTIDLADRLSYTRLERNIEIVCDNPDVPSDETNLAYRAAVSLRDFTGLKYGVRMTIGKRIPVAGGLGGGSSNAAVTLIALQKLWNVQLRLIDLFRLGSKLGSDVPFFISGGTCLGVGRGNEVYPLADLAADFLLLVNPGIKVETAEAYANLPPELTNHAPADKMPFSLEASQAGLSTGNRRSEPIWNRLHNDLEVPVLARYPLLGEIKERLRQTGARGILMSGSGSTIFAIFESEKGRHSALENLSETGWWCALARTLSRKECQEAYRSEGRGMKDEG
ncbi:MAG: 4-(cytidine 5'-diphospho)-2-C-methyl-D-erythritol kinase [Acidobacteria bacterium]|nr:4-(cytidine 5'-diphospho)-2-C-methyl-D-erythritol kinase [Acidobacteriota bacterium]